jgi:hypothetical protein
MDFFFHINASSTHIKKKKKKEEEEAWVLRLHAQ